MVMHCCFMLVYMHVCISVTVNFGHLDCAITTDTRQHEEQLEAIPSPEVVVHPLNMVCFDH